VLFLRLNGLSLVVPGEDAAAVILRLAAGEIGEDELTHWIKTHLTASAG
jgi:death-on-curing protein